MTPLERLRSLSSSCAALSKSAGVVLLDDLAKALAVIDKAQGTAETGGDDVDRALEELWDALEAINEQ